MEEVKITLLTKTKLCGKTLDKVLSMLLHELDKLEELSSEDWCIKVEK